MTRDVPTRMFGWGKNWRDDGTATEILFFFFIPVWRLDFAHSTGWHD